MEIVAIALASVGGIALCALAHQLTTSWNQVKHNAGNVRVISARHNEI